jgi:hypothetical protein
MAGAFTKVREELGRLELELLALTAPMWNQLRAGVADGARLPPALKALAARVAGVRATIEQQTDSLPAHSRGGFRTGLNRDQSWPLATQLMSPAASASPPQISEAGAMTAWDEGANGLGDLALAIGKLERSAGFGQLDSATRGSLRDALTSTEPHRIGDRLRVSMFIDSPTFDAATPARQAKALRVLEGQLAGTQQPQGHGPAFVTVGLGSMLGSRPPARLDDVMRALSDSEGWPALSNEGRDRILRRVMLPGGHGELVRGWASALLIDPGFWLGDAARQADRLTEMRSAADLAWSQPRTNEAMDRLKEGELASNDAAELRQLAADSALQNPFAMSTMAWVMNTPEWSRATPKARAAAIRAAVSAELTVASVMNAPGWSRGTPQERAAAVRAALSAEPGTSGPRTGDEVQQRLQDSAGWSLLRHAEQATLRERVSAQGERGEQCRRGLWATLSNPLSLIRTPSEQAQGLRDFISASHLVAGNDPTCPLPSDALHRVRALPGYGQLEPRLRGRLDALLKGPTNSLSQAARSQIDSYIVQIDADTATVQADALREFLSNGPHLPALAAGLAPPGRPREATVGTTTQVPDFRFAGKAADAEMMTLTFGLHTITLIRPLDTVPTPPDVLPSAQDVAKALSRLPPDKLEAIKRVTLNPMRNPSDAFWSDTYKMPDFHSSACASPDGDVIVFPTQWNEELLSRVLGHELGHVLDPALREEPGQDALEKEWDEAQVADGTFCSTYSRVSRREDTAEVSDLYWATLKTPAHDELRDIFPNRFAILDQRMG